MLLEWLAGTGVCMLNMAGAVMKAPLRVGDYILATGTNRLPYRGRTACSLERSASAGPVPLAHSTVLLPYSVSTQA